MLFCQLYLFVIEFKKGYKMSFIKNERDDAVKSRRITRVDAQILSAKSEAKCAKAANYSTYVRAELRRILEARALESSAKIIANCERIKKDSIKEIKKEFNLDDEQIEKSCNEAVNKIIVEAALQCRNEKKNYMYPFLQKHLSIAFKEYYGKEL